MEEPSTAAGSLLDVAARFLQSSEWSNYTADLELFFGVQALFFVVTPLTIMLWRLALNWKDGFLAMFAAPLGRKGNVRTPSAALRFALFQQSSIGYTLDVTQAIFSAISCIMFICVAYSTYDPDSVQDIEFFFTVYFFGDYMLRLYIAPDSLSFFFSGGALRGGGGCNEWRGARWVALQCYRSAPITLACHPISQCQCWILSPLCPQSSRGSCRGCRRLRPTSRCVLHARSLNGRFAYRLVVGALALVQQTRRIVPPLPLPPPSPFPHPHRSLSSASA